MNAPIVSVIVPNYNHLAFLPQRIESILNQSFQNFELILLDDCSSDGSAEWLLQYKEHPKVSHVLVNSENSGSAFKQWYKGISIAAGRYIWIAESDDVADERFLERLLGKFDNHNDKLAFSYCQSFILDECDVIRGSRVEHTNDFSPNIWRDDFEFEGKQFISNFLKVKNLVPNASAVVFSKLHFNKIKDFSYMEMKKCGDWLFWIRIAELGRVSFVSEHLNYFREHSGVTRNHKSLEQVHTRCIEERSIRVLLQNHYSIEQERELVTLYHRWFSWHDWTAIFEVRFYSICMPRTSYLSYLSCFFVKIKIRDRLITKLRKLLVFNSDNK